MDTRQVRIISLTPLITAKDNYYNHPGTPVFTINFASVNNNNPDVGYSIYRYIGPYPVDSTIDPIVDTPELFKKIATVAPNVSTYDDYFTDLNLNGYTNNNGTWIDGSGRNVPYQIFTTRRAIYYKVVGINNQTVSFNSTPFIFVGHEDGTLQCRSTITQVKYNQFYNEGDVLWTNKLYPYAIKSISVDQNYSDRQYTVWVAYTTSTLSKIVRMDVETGGINLTHVYEIPFPIYGIRVDPSTANGGDCIATGKNNSLVRCIMGSPGVYHNFGNTTLPTGDYGGFALSLIRDTNTDVVDGHVIWNRQYATKWGVTTPSNTTYQYNVSSIGDFIATQYNSNGVTTGGNGDVFCNGRRKVKVAYTTTYSVPGHPGGTTQNCYQICGGQAYTNGNDGNGCHLTCQTVNTPGSPSTVGHTTNYSNWFYADEGYFYQLDPNVLINKKRFTSCPYEAAYSSRGSWPCKGDGHDSPDPNNLGSTFWGIKTDFPTSGGITSDNYNVWQALDIEKRIQSQAWNGSTNTYGASSTYLLGQGMDIGEVIVDSENCIWGISRTAANHAKIYPSTMSINPTDFPSGINCVWPVSGSNAWTYGSMFLNDPYVEYVLTRDVTLMGATPPAQTLFWSITSTNNDSLKRSLARTWVDLYYNTYTTGTKVYGRGTLTNPAYIPRVYNVQSFHPNSDETGTQYIMSRHDYYSLPAYIHPDYIAPTIDLVLIPQGSRPQLTDTTFWNDQKQATTAIGASGYDDLSVSLSANITNNNTFEIKSYDFGFGDRIHDICGDSKCTCADTYPNCGNNVSKSSLVPGVDITSNTTSYKYHDPSNSGKPGSRWNGAPGETTGTYTAHATAFSDPNPYLLSGTSIFAGIDYPVPSTGKTVTVWERWPTARFYINPVNLNAMRDNWFGTTLWVHHDNPGAIDNGLSVYDENRVCSGLAPLSADITDISIGRTWPLSSWNINFKSDESPYSAFFHVLTGTPYFYDYEYPPTNLIRSDDTIQYTTSTALITTSDPNYHHRDSSSEIHNNFARHVYFHPGTYQLTLFSQASNTGTETADISVGVTDVHTLSTFTKYATRTLIVKEACPWANFITTSAITVPSNYSDEYGMVVANPICAAYINPYSHGIFISGYAPNLTVTWMDSSVARSYPLCAYDWNFGDYYDELHNLSSVYVTQLNTGYPTWFSDKTNHHVSHTYAMPGVYDVSLDLRVSGTDTGACEVCSKHLHVYVEEIPLQPCFTYSILPTANFDVIPLTGLIAPVTVYVNPSCVVPGSFPICRIDWDFGDGSDIFTVSRNMSSISMIPLTSYPLDVYDPRNYIASHTYQRNTAQDQSTFNITMTAYACNTNSHAVTSHDGALSGLQLPPYNDALSHDDMPLHLIGNRNFGTVNNTMLVFEGRKGYTLNYILSTGE